MHREAGGWYCNRQYGFELGFKMPNNAAAVNRTSQTNKLQRGQYHLNATVVAERQEQTLQIDRKTFAVVGFKDRVNSTSCTGALV